MQNNHDLDAILNQQKPASAKSLPQAAKLAQFVVEGKATIKNPSSSSPSAEMRSNFWSETKLAKTPWKENGKKVVTIYPFYLKPGTKRETVILMQIPVPIGVHPVNTYYDKPEDGTPRLSNDFVRCSNIDVTFHDGEPQLTEESNNCIFCKALYKRSKKFRMFVFVGGILDTDVLEFNKRSSEIKFKQFVPKILILKDQVVTTALNNGMTDEVSATSPFPWIGPTFAVARDSATTSSTTGSWFHKGGLNKLFTYKPEEKCVYLISANGALEPVYYDIDVNDCFPKLDGKTKSIIPCSDHIQLAKEILARHVIVTDLAMKDNPTIKMGLDYNTAFDILKGTVAEETAKKHLQKKDKDSHIVDSIDVKSQLKVMPSNVPTSFESRMEVAETETEDEDIKPAPKASKVKHEADPLPENTEYFVKAYTASNKGMPDYNTDESLKKFLKLMGLPESFITVLKEKIQKA